MGHRMILPTHTPKLFRKLSQFGEVFAPGLIHLANAVAGLFMLEHFVRLFEPGPHGQWCNQSQFGLEFFGGPADENNIFGDEKNLADGRPAQQEKSEDPGKPDDQADWI